jgi:threonine synthase
MEDIVTLHEGGTPLLRDPDGRDLFFKYEGVNPTGSFKDRGTAIEISRAKELGVQNVACATTGNMGASVSAYCAVAKMNAHIFTTKFAEPAKIRQIKAYGASVTVVPGTYDDALAESKKTRDEKGYYLMGDYPLRGEGQKSVAFEIADQLNWGVPDNVIVPIGNGTLAWATYKAFRELETVGLTNKMPRIIGVQARGCNPVYNSFIHNLDYIVPLKKTNTIASAINCNNPVDGLETLTAIRESNGLCIQLSDEEILRAKAEMGKLGIYAEVSGAASYGAYKKLKLGGKTVCVVTGHGLKDSK